MAVSARSLANLKPGESHPMYSENKKQRSVTITETGWSSIKGIAKAKGLSVSELIEQIGRGKFQVIEH